MPGKPSPVATAARVVDPVHCDICSRAVRKGEIVVVIAEKRTPAIATFACSSCVTDIGNATDELHKRENG